MIKNLTAQKNNPTTAITGAKGLLAVVSAPSGAGKTSVLFEVLKRCPEINFSVSVTTRTPRSGEKDGVNYHFISEEEFDKRLSKGELLEWNLVHGEKYGTVKANVEQALANGESLLFDTDTVGAFNIKKHFPDAVLIFIIPPSPKVLQERLMNRKSESSESIKNRLAAAPKEIAHMTEYDYIVINDNLETAVSQIIAILETEKIKSWKIITMLSEWRKYING